MKKTISVNIKGLNFLIEEDGYELLQDYLKRLENALQNQEGSKDIIEDVELRIAELCSSKLNDQKTVIEESDIRDILATLGDPEEYVELDDEEATSARSTYESNSDQSSEKRLFRDIDRATIGGVCAGLSSFFNIDVVIIRAIFVVLFLFGGFGFPLYIILWIIIPKAQTTIDRLRMKGRPITVETVKEEVEGAAERIKQSSSKFASRIRQDEVHYKSRISRGLQVIGVLFGIGLVGIGLSMLVTFLTFIVGGLQFIPVQSETGFLSLSEFGTFVLSSESDVTLAWIGGLLISLCSILFFILLGSMLIFRLRNKWTKVSLILLFLGGFAGGIITFSLGVRTARDFAIEGELEREVGQIATKELVIETELEKLENIEEFNIKSNGQFGLIQVDEKNIKLHGVHFIYKRSADSLFHVHQNLSAHSHTHKVALEKSKNIHHSIGLHNDTLFVSPDYSFPKKDKLRDQEVYVIIEVPVDGQIRIADRIVRLGSEEFDEDIVDENYIEEGYLKSNGRYKHWD